MNASPPLRRGTAAKLGLRPPRPRFILTTKRHLTEQEAEELKARWLKAMESPRIEVLRDPPTDTKWIKFERVGGHPDPWFDPASVELTHYDGRPVRRPWWKRRAK